MHLPEGAMLLPAANFKSIFPVKSTIHSFLYLLTMAELISGNRKLVTMPKIYAAREGYCIHSYLSREQRQRKDRKGL